MNNKFETLSQLFSCYFHQDWLVEFDSSNKAIDAFVKKEPKENILAAKGEVQRIILASNFSSDELDTLLRELGCYYDPIDDYSNIHIWLKSIDARLGK